jgi:hypothetical protein
MEEELETGVAPNWPISGVRANPDGSIARNVQLQRSKRKRKPPNWVSRRNLTSSRSFSTSRSSTLTQMFRDAPGGPARVIARELAGELSQGNSEFFSYESLAGWNGAPV